MGLQPQRLRENICMAPTVTWRWDRGPAKGPRDLHGEAALPIDPAPHGFHGSWPNVGAKLPSVLQVVVVFMWQRNDQLKIGHP